MLTDGLAHVPYCLEATQAGEVVGLLPLAYVKSALFGRHLVGLPYLNTGGVLAKADAVRHQLVSAAMDLADQLAVKQLQLRHEVPVEHPGLAAPATGKVHMRLDLPSTVDALWKQLSAKVRNQVRKAEKESLRFEWGGQDKLNDFYAVFSRNMRDLGTPVYSRRLFAAMLQHLAGDAELCIVYADRLPVAAAIVIHGQGMTQVPSASSLREFNRSCPNMLLYWQLLVRSIERGQTRFDFGRSTAESNTYRFKEQWGAAPTPAAWQFYVRSGAALDLRPDQGKFQLATRLWQRLPLAVSRWLGPAIIRGIP